MGQVKTKRSDNKMLPHRVLREVYRHYIDFQDYYQRTGNDTIEYKGFTLSFLDLKNTLGVLSKRKQQAFKLNIIEDRKQEDVARMMKITTVTVGQYVDQSCIKLAKTYFPEYFDNTIKQDKLDT